jgi:hypothetical protein
MSDWQQVFAPMELALEQMLARTLPPSTEPIEIEPPLCGALPLLDEVLSPVARAVARTEEHAHAVDLHLEDAVLVLEAWRERAAALRQQLATPPLCAVS